MSNPACFNKGTLIFNLLPFSPADSTLLCCVKGVTASLIPFYHLLKTNASTSLGALGFSEVGFNSKVTSYGFHTLNTSAGEEGGRPGLQVNGAVAGSDRRPWPWLPG